MMIECSLDREACRARRSGVGMAFPSGRRHVAKCGNFKCCSQIRRRRVFNDTEEHEAVTFAVGGCVVLMVGRSQAGSKAGGECEEV